MGGFHLSGPFFEPLIPRVLDDLAALTPSVIVPAECNEVASRARHGRPVRVGVHSQLGRDLLRDLRSVAGGIAWRRCRRQRSRSPASVRKLRQADSESTRTRGLCCQSRCQLHSEIDSRSVLVLPPPCVPSGSLCNPSRRVHAAESGATHCVLEPRRSLLPATDDLSIPLPTRPKGVPTFGRRRNTRNTRFVGV